MNATPLFRIKPTNDTKINYILIVVYKTTDKVYNFTGWKLTGECNEPCILVCKLYGTCNYQVMTDSSTF